MTMDFEDIKKEILNHFGITENDTYNIIAGCYCNGRWLSIETILDILENECY